MDFLFTQLFHMIFDKAAKLITSISALSIDIFSQDAVKSLLDFFQILGWMILAVGILFGIANYCIENIEGDITSLEELFMNIFKGVIAICFMQPAALFVFNLANVITSAIHDISKIDEKTMSDVINIISSLIGLYGIIWAIVLGLIYLGLLFFLYIQAFKRSGMYLMQIMVGYLYIFGIPSGNTEGILDWTRQTVALATTNVLQISSLIIAINLIINNNFWASIVILLAATSADTIAGRFGMSAGGRRTISGMARGVSSGVTTVSRIITMANKGV